MTLSWVTAVTVPPVICVMFLKAPKLKAGEEAKDPYGGLLYSGYRGLLLGCIRFRWLTVAVVLAAFGTSLWGFQFVDNTFFPNSTRPQFMVDFWLPQGTHINDTMAVGAEVGAEVGVAASVSVAAAASTERPISVRRSWSGPGATWRRSGAVIGCPK